MQSIYLSDLPTLSLRDLGRLGLLPHPEREDVKRGEITISHTIGLSKSVYCFIVEVESFGDGRGTLTLQYMRGGEVIRYAYPLIVRESNLPSGGLYFLISFKNNRSNKLYLYDGYFCPRSSLPFLEYETSAQSKRWREIERDGNINQMERIFRKGGKVHYRGKLTPYGQKLCKYWRQIERVYSSYTTIPKERRRTIGVLYDIMYRSS